MVKQAVAFGKVNYVDMHSVHELACILHAKVEPLQVTVAVCVVAHEAVESVVGSESHLIKVRAFKVGIEGQR